MNVRYRYGHLSGETKDEEARDGGAADREEVVPIVAPASGIGHYDLDEPEEEFQVEINGYRDAKTPSTSIFCGGDALSFLACSALLGDDDAVSAPRFEMMTTCVEPGDDVLDAVPEAAAPETAKFKKHGSGDMPRIYNGAIYAAATIEQVPYVRVGEKRDGGCAEARYDIFGGEDQKSPARRLLVAHEESKFCSRWLCSPCHSHVVRVMHVGSRETLLTLERPGVECCCDRGECGAKPCLCCPAWTEACADSIIIHEGDVAGVAGYLPTDKYVGVVHEETSCGCAPTYEAVDNDSRIVGYLEGPSCFGGCCDFLRGPPAFSFSNERGGAGNKGRVTHRKFCAKDRMDVEMPMMPGGDKLQLLAGALLIDKAHFARDHGCCRWRMRTHGLSVTCCLCYACGCFCPLGVTLEPWPCGAQNDDERAGPASLDAVRQGRQRAHRGQSNRHSREKGAPPSAARMAR